MRTYTVVIMHRLLQTFREADVRADSPAFAEVQTRLRKSEEIVSISAKHCRAPIRIEPGRARRVY